ncbi:MAG: 2OG-Fe(II) oxygenase [Myxococcales bacterium]|nr:2OG-Fe(II) oxygenase [Myxococcales bacterium]
MSSLEAPPNYLDVLVVPASDRHAAQGAYGAILDGGLGALVLRGAFEPAALAAASARLSALEVPEHLRHAPVVSRLDEPAMGVVGRCMRLSGLEDYPKSAAETRALFGQIFDDPEGLEGGVAAFLRELSGGEVRSPPGAFAPALISRLRGGAEIPYHFDNFVLLEETAFRLVAPLIESRTLLNVQVPLQRPDAGGHLELASYHWDDFVQAGAPRPDAHVDTPARDATHHRLVELEVGDMLLFDAGRICHRVTPVVGARERLTYVVHTAPLRDGSGVAYFT